MAFQLKLTTFVSGTTVKFITGKNYGEEVYKIIEEVANFTLEQFYQEYICGEK